MLAWITALLVLLATVALALYAFNKRALDPAQSLRAWIREVDRRERKLANVESRTVDLDDLEAHEANLDASETVIESGGEKHTVQVGQEHGSVGETVSFTADLLGTAHVNGGVEGGGLDYTFYCLPDGNLRVLVEVEGITMLVPSNMMDAISSGQRNNYSYGRITLQEMNAHGYNLGEVYEALMKEHPETVRNRVRDID